MLKMVIEFFLQCCFTWFFDAVRVLVQLSVFP